MFKAWKKFSATAEALVENQAEILCQLRFKRTPLQKKKKE